MLAQGVQCVPDQGHSMHGTPVLHARRRNVRSGDMHAHKHIQALLVGTRIEDADGKPNLAVRSNAAINSNMHDMLCTFTHTIMRAWGAAPFETLQPAGQKRGVQPTLCLPQSPAPSLKSKCSPPGCCIPVQHNISVAFNQTTGMIFSACCLPPPMMQDGMGANRKAPRLPRPASHSRKHHPLPATPLPAAAGRSQLHPHETAIRA